MKRKILVVEDEPDIRDLLTYNLNREGFAVQAEGDGSRAWSLIRKSPPDLVLLDLMLPGLDGLELCRLIRKDPATQKVLVIMLTAKSEPLEKVVGLEIGADDYVTKPFHVRELLARIKALFRRLEYPDLAGKALAYRDLKVDFDRCEVRRGGKKLALGVKEMKILEILAGRPNRVYSRQQILDLVWGDDTFVEPRTVDVHVSRLRAALEDDQKKPEYIITVRGFGYKFGEND
jgi:DNA-binding response OmpR family regulator